MGQDSKKAENTSASDVTVEPRLESLEEIREASAFPRVATQKEKGRLPETESFRPVHRPPMAMVCILDDGCDEGEWVRIRGDKLTIGRSEGDIVIGHDGMLSSKHAEISRQVVKGGFRWYLTDLKSTNGTFVRLASAPIKHGQEILIGSRRYRFNAAPQGAALLAEKENADAPLGTRGWQAVSPKDLIPSLVEITPQGEGQHFMLKNNDVWIGRDATQCTVAIPDDLMISPRHCHLHRTSSAAQWQLDNDGSRNGTWVRINKVALGANGQFQLGEQRFLVRTLT